MHLKHLNEHYAHQVSKEIIDFCKEKHTGILVLPEYDEDFSRISMYRSGNYSPLHLSIRIRNYLKYKAWAEGILVLELRADGTEKQCSICGATGKKQGSVFICQNGHQVNRFLNAPEIWDANARKASGKITNQVNKRQECLLYINAE